MATMRSSYPTLSLPTLPTTSPTTIAGPWLAGARETAARGTPSLSTHTRRINFSLCSARRRIRYDEGEDDGDEAYNVNPQLAMLESYTESARSEALLVRAGVEDEEEVVLIFKGFSSLLSGRTSPDPSRSVLPAAAVIKSIDVIKGPFDPSNIEFIERGLTWDAFNSRLKPYNRE